MATRSLLKGELKPGLHDNFFGTVPVWIWPRCLKFAARHSPFLSCKPGFFLLVRCIYNKQNNTWLLGDMEFLFSYSTRYLTRSTRSLVRYRVEHLINPIFARSCIWDGHGKMRIRPSRTITGKGQRVNNNKFNRRHDTVRLQTIKLHHFPWISVCFICLFPLCFLRNRCSIFPFHPRPLSVLRTLRWHVGVKTAFKTHAPRQWSSSRA